MLGGQVKIAHIAVDIFINVCKQLLYLNCKDIFKLLAAADSLISPYIRQLLSSNQVVIALGNH